MVDGSAGVREDHAPQMQGPSRITRNCVSCGRAIDWNANVCAYCGYDYRIVAGPPPAVTSAKPVVAGVMIIIAGLLAIAMGFVLIALDISDIEEMGITQISEGEVSLAEIEEMMHVCGALEFVFGSIAIIGGLFALIRKYFYFALVGGIFGLLCLGFLVGALFGLIGVILLLLSRSEFKPSAQPHQHA